MSERPWLCPRDETCRSRRGHDNARGYDAGCRSRLALDDIIRAQRERTNRLVPIIGTARKLQALGRLGYSSRRLGRDHFFCTGEHVCQLRRPDYDTCWSETAARVNAVFVELSEADPPVGPGATRTRNDAARRGWQPVEAWDGVDIDEPAARPWSGRASAPDDYLPALYDAVTHGRVQFSDLHPRAQDAVISKARREVAPNVEPERIRLGIADRLGIAHGDVSRVLERIATRQKRDAA